MTTDADAAHRWATDAACRDAVARAARLADLQDYDGLAALFTEDAELQRPGGPWLKGRAAILAAYRARPPARLTRHLVAASVVDPLGADEAVAHSTVLLCTGDAGDAAGAFGRPARGPWVVGEFEDRLRREADGCWRIARRRAQFLLQGADHG